jgi:hypothetical protein
MFDFEPITEINGWKGHQVRWIFLNPGSYWEAHIPG